VIVVTIGDERGRLRRLPVGWCVRSSPPVAALVAAPAPAALDRVATGAARSRLAPRADVRRSRRAASRERRPVLDRDPAAGRVVRVEDGGSVATGGAPAVDGATAVEEGNAVAVVAATAGVTGAGEAAVADVCCAVEGSDVAVSEIEVEVEPLVTSLDGLAFCAACVCPAFPREPFEEAESPAPRRACPPPCRS
jgi:hypothetical protein